MKRLSLLVSVFVIALMAFVAVASAQQTSVFGNNVLVRGFIECTGGCGPAETPSYSAYLEVRDDTGAILPVADFAVTGVLGTATPNVAVNPFLIHNNDLVNNDITMSFDKLTNTIYVFCTDGTVVAPNLHVMTYEINSNSSVNGVCVTYSQGLTQVPIDLCSSGSASAVSGQGPWSWTCYGENGGQNASCSAQKKVDGVCGSSNLQTFTSVPTTNLCSAGTASSVSGSGPWSWTCNGSYGGSTASCSANIQTGSAADLTVSYFRATSAGSNGLGVPATVTVTNLGTGAAGPFTVKIYMSHGYTAEGSQLLVNGTKTVSGLAAGASTTLTFSDMTFSGLILHTYYHIIAVADADGQVGETNEDNNIKYRDFEVM
ncbi:MAG: CARDB domain-containing protein [Thermodesulfovibrionales bacterium]|jgi:hypothetical protein